MRSLCFFAITTLTIFGMIGCRNTAETKNGKIHGSILLDGHTDQSGVTVLLYIDNIVDTELQQINQDYPTIGFEIESRHVFDHREHIPVQEALTDNGGRFEFQDVPYGKYLVVYYKEGWGFNYIFDIELTTPDYFLPEGLYTLYETTSVPFVNNGEIQFLADRCYLILGDTVFLSDSVVRIEHGARILIEPNSRITIDGSLIITTIEGPMIQFTSSDQIYDYNRSPSYARSIEILPNAIISELTDLAVSDLTDGLVIKTSGSAITNSVFHNNARSCYFEYSANHVFRNNYVLGNSESLPSVNFQRGNTVTIERNCFLNNYNSLKLDFSDNCIVRNNYFAGGELHIDQVYSSTGLIEFNEFKHATIAVSNSSKSNMTLQYNLFDSGVCVYLGRGDFGTMEQGWTIANDNNFLATSYAVEVATKYYYPNNEPYPLDFRDNYWNTTSSTEISALVYDVNDAGPASDEWNWGRVDYTPFKMSPVPTAGIQPL